MGGGGTGDDQLVPHSYLIFSGTPRKKIREL